MIIISSNEASQKPELFDKLVENFKVSVKPIEVGDFIVGDVLIELKTPMDFKASIIDKRLWKQLNNMKEQTAYKPLIVILTSDFWRDICKSGYVNKYTYSSIEGAKRSIVDSYNIPLIEVDEVEFIDLLKGFEKHQRRSGEYVFPKKRMETLEERKIEAISCAEGVSSGKARLVLEQFKTLRSVASASVDDLKSIKGIGDKIAQNIYDMFNG